MADLPGRRAEPPQHPGADAGSQLGPPLADRLPAVAARALAAADATRRNLATALFPALAPLVDHLAARSREQLGERAYDAAWAEGRQWSLLQALDRTLEELTDTDRPPVADVMALHDTDVDSGTTG